MNGKTTGGFAAFVFVAFFVCLVLGMGQCAPGPEKAVSTLRAMGFSEIKVTDSHQYFASWHGCDEKDGVAHEASATNAAGQKVNVVVCCGYVLKGCTVRTP